MAVGDGEAEWRTAISRAYYASFHAARDLLTACGFAVPDSDRAHSYLERRMMNSGDTLLAQAGRELAGLRSARNEADYDIGHDIAQRAASHWVYIATDVVQTLEDYRAEPARFPGLCSTISAYERDILHEATFRGPTVS